MKRLMRRSTVGEGLPVNHIHIMHMSPDSEENLTEVFERLTEYEDTGLSPQEINSLNTFDGSQGMKYLKLYQEEQRKHRWIPVSEQLPENIIEIATEEEYLRQTKLVTDGEAVTLMIYENGKFRDIIDRDDVYDCITAWMPLPESYRP